MTETATSLSGQTIRWKFEEGPTAGGTYEHTFDPDGSVSFRKLDGAAEGKPTRVKKYGSLRSRRRSTWCPIWRRSPDTP